MTAGLMGCIGRAQKVGSIIHVVADDLENLTPLLNHLSESGDRLSTHAGRGDEAVHNSGGERRGVRRKNTPSSTPVWKHPRSINVIAEHAKAKPPRPALPLKSRDFH